VQSATVPRNSPTPPCVHRRATGAHAVSKLIPPSSRIVLSFICPCDEGYPSRGSYICRVHTSALKSRPYQTTCPGRAQEWLHEDWSLSQPPSFSCLFWNGKKRCPEILKQPAPRSSSACSTGGGSGTETLPPPESRDRARSALRYRRAC